jgi:hypothetical protein
MIRASFLFWYLYGLQVVRKLMLEAVISSSNKKLSAVIKTALSLRSKVFIFFIGNQPGGVHSQYLAKGAASANPVAYSQSCQACQISEI